MVVTPHDDVPLDLREILGDARILPGPSDAEMLELLGRHPAVRLLILLEGEQAAADRALELLQLAKTQDERLAVLVLSADPTIQHATEAIRRGAEDFVPLGFSTELIRKAVERALEAVALRDDVRVLRSLLSTTYGFDSIISNAPCMRPVFERAMAASRSDTPVLITGETGTGKELLARAIHANSPRRTRAFVPVNCAALPPELLESELFGHRKGAFSGAHRDHPGLFCAAHRGTILLDEIGELPLAAQAKLLRVLQSGEVRAVGSLDSRIVDVRVIAATNRSVRALRDGALRHDLFFRLSVLPIELPPLRQRLDDLPRLVEHFLTRCRGGGLAKLCAIEQEALDLLGGYAFPGNVRELENLIESLCLTLPPEQPAIRAADVRAWLRRQGAMPGAGQVTFGDLPFNLHDLERRAIRAALEQTHGNKSQAAALLGISRDTLYRRLLEDDEEKGAVVRLDDRRAAARRAKVSG